MNLTMFDREYGSLATIGITVSQANTTVEPEMAALMPNGVSMLIGQLQRCRVNSRNRLLKYLGNFGETLSHFDTAPLDDVGYACSATSYLIGDEQEERRIGEFSAKGGFPIATAAQAMYIESQPKWFLTALNTKTGQALMRWS